MPSWAESLLGWLDRAPDPLVYLLVGTFAALENIVPPVPADVIAFLGGFVAGRGATSLSVTFLVVWLCNVLGALLVYAAGRRWGSRFFQGRLGGWILRPQQLVAMQRFYRRYGVAVIFVSRFLPMFRAVVPAFAGVAGVGIVRTAVPLAAASAVWYGLIVWLGSIAGRNWQRIWGAIESTGGWLWLAAGVALAGVSWWWWRSRMEEAVEEETGETAGHGETTVGEGEARDVRRPRADDARPGRKQ